MRFLVKHSSHSEKRWVESTQEEQNAGVPGMIKRPNGKHYHLVTNTYERGQTVETDEDLVAKFGKKFEKIHSTSTIRNPWEDLENLTVKQLKSLAETEEIDLGSLVKKEEIVKLLTEISTGETQEV